MGGRSGFEPFAGLLVAAQAGDEAAWTKLYRDHAPSLLGYLRGSGADDAEDLLGDVFLHAVRDLARFRGDERAFRSWMFTLAHHRLLDARRRARRRPLALMAEPPESADPGDGPGSVAARGAELAEVISLLGALPGDQRTVLLLRIVGDLTVPEIGRVMRKRPGAVKALQRRGLAALERRLDRQAYPFTPARRFVLGDSTFVPRHG